MLAMPKPQARLNGTPRASDQAQAKGASFVKHPDRGVASATGPALSPTESTLLALQRLAGNEAMTQVLQRWGAPTAAIAGAKANIRADELDVVHGFMDLAVSAVDKGGRTLDTVRLGPNLSAENRALLERLRHVLILVQQGPKAKRTAMAEWPSLAAKLQSAFDEAKRLGVDSEEADNAADNLAFVGESYVGAPHSGPSEVENPADYVDLMQGIQKLLLVIERGDVDKRYGYEFSYTAEMNRKQRSELEAVQFDGKNLNHRHRELLVNLRHALMLARTEGNAREARDAWQSIQGDLQHVFRRAAEFVAERGEGPNFQERLNIVGAQLIEGGVYTEAHQAAKKNVHIASPDEPLQNEQLKDAAEGFEEANDLAKKTTELVGSNVIKQALGGKVELGEAIIKLATSPGEIVENFKKFKEKGTFGKFVTAGDIAAKTLELRNSLVRVSCETLKRFALRQAEVAGEKAVAEGWHRLATWAGGKLELLEKVDKVATVITIAVSAFKVIEYIKDGKWSEAVGEAGVTAIGVAAKAPVEAAFDLGGGAVGVVGVTVVVVWAEAEALHGAAAMKEWAEKSSIREAAWTFVDVCSHANDLAGADFIADVKLRADPAHKAEWPLIDKNLKSRSRYWLADIEQLSEQVKDDRTIRVGGQPALLGALGMPAMSYLQAPSTWAQSWEMMALQMGLMFAGANRMAKYVVEHYPRSEKAAEKKKEGGE
jgi:hypothetical protein